MMPSWIKSLLFAKCWYHVSYCYIQLVSIKSIYVNRLEPPRHMVQGCGVEWIHLAHIGVQWWALNEPLGSKKGRQFLD